MIPIITRIKIYLIDRKPHYKPEVFNWGTLRWKGLHEFDKGILPSKIAVSVRTTRSKAIGVIHRYAQQVERDKIIFFV